MEFLDVTLQPREVIEEQVYVKPRYNWIYENSINSGKELIDLDVKQEFKYDKYRTNTTLSYHNETLLQANEMNKNYHLSDKLHYHYLFYSVRKKTRYGKKKTEEDKRIEKQMKADQELLTLIQDYYKYNVIKAKQALMILTKEQIDFIIKKQEKGGIK